MEYIASPDEELDTEMPLFSWGKKDVGAEINYKAKLEHKLLLVNKILYANSTKIHIFYKR